jgi:hypothetical protein
MIKVVSSSSKTEVTPSQSAIIDPSHKKKIYGKKTVLKT